jgi:threonine-phosphate decarboxylase
VDVAAISIGSGVMPLLDAAISALRLRRCLVPVPSFAEYRKVLGACGVECCTLTVRPDTDFSLDGAQVLAELNASRAQAILLANPQSPSGRLMPANELLRLHKAVSELGIATIVDEAFIDYAPEESLSRSAATMPSLVVLRSLTKFFAMPGLRVAYAIACPEMRVSMESCVPAWPVGSIAAEAACMVLRDHASITATRETNARERCWLREQLQSLGLRVFPGAANYLLVKIDVGRNGPELWRRLILEHRVVIRSCANFEGLDEHYFRVAVRTRVDNQRLLDALAAVLCSTLPKCPNIAGVGNAHMI